MVKALTVALSFVLLYNLLFYHVQPGIGVGLAVFTLNLYFYLTRSSQAKEINLALSFSGIATVFGFLIGFRDDGVVQVANDVAILFFSGVAFYLYKATNPFQYKIVNTLLMPLASGIDFIFSAFSLKPASGIKNSSSEKSSSLIKGLLIATPLSLVLFMLLVAADPVFAKLVDLLLKDIKERLFVSVVLLTFLLIASKTVIRESVNQLEKSLTDLPLGKPYELLVILGSITTLFLAFIIVQFRYLFSKVSEATLSSIGINSQTYSEYVRKGFFELLIVAAISALVTVYILRFLHRLKAREKLITQSLTGVLIVETGLILASAFQRVNLYVQAHGLTRARGFGVIFFIWLSLILLVLLVEVIQKQKTKVVFYSTGIVTLVALLLFNLINVDGLMATKFKPTVNNEVDYYYLAQLSSDTYPAWVEAINQAEATLPAMEKRQTGEITPEDGRVNYYARHSLDLLKRKVDYLSDKYGTEEQLNNKYANKIPQRILEFRKWQSFRYSEFMAYQFILQNVEVFKRLPDLTDRANRIDGYIPNTVKKDIRLDRSTQAPLQ